MLINWLVALLFATPLVALAAHLATNCSTSKMISCAIQFVACLAFFCISLGLLLLVDTPKTFQISGWPEPFCITLLFDKLTALIVFCFAIVTFSINLYSHQDHDIEHLEKGFYCGLWLLIFGIIGALSTFDIFNLYVWMEVILLSAFILLSASQKQNTFNIYHYAVFNIVGTLLLLLAIAFVYSVTGSLNMGVIAEQLQLNNNSIFVTIIGLFLLSLSIKGGLFPFYFWLPSAYPNTSSSSTMLLSSLVTKTIMIVFLRLTWLWSLNTNIFFSNLFILIACATMFFGVIGAANHFRIRNILSFHIISQLGYILLAIFIPTQWGIVAAIFFLIHNIFTKTNLFMVGGLIEQQYGVTLLDDIRRLMKTDPILASIFFISAMSLAGFPPLSGFWGKLLVIRESVNNHYIVPTVIAIIVSLFTFYSMIKIWRFGFSERNNDFDVSLQSKNLTVLQSIAIAPLLIIPVFIGLFPDSILPRLHSIAAELSHTHVVINNPPREIS